MDTDQKHLCTLNLRPIALKWGQQTLFMRLNSAETCGSADESRALALNLDRKFHDGEGTGACIVVSVGMQCMARLRGQIRYHDQDDKLREQRNDTT